MGAYKLETAHAIENHTKIKLITKLKPYYSDLYYPLRYKPEPGLWSTKGERLVNFCLGELKDRRPLPCTQDPDYLKNNFVMLFRSEHRRGLLRNLYNEEPFDQKKIIGALVAQRTLVPDHFSCWLIADDSGGKNSDPNQGLHITGMRRKEHGHLVLVPTGNRNRFLGPLLAQQMEKLREEWIRWDEKSDSAWWGGALTGDLWRRSDPFPLTRRDVLDYYMKNPSKSVVLHLASAPHNSPPPGVRIKGKFVKSEAFSHKCLVMLPGNDIASGSSWYFSGNSVVLMQPPHMEHILYFEMNPWEHYVPLENDPADILVKLHWVLDNQEEAKHIVERAHRRLEWLTGPEYLWACNEVFRRISGSIEVGF